MRGKGRFMITEFVPTRRAHQPRLPADPHHRPHPVAVQCRRADAAHRQCRCGIARTCWRSIRSTPRTAASRDGDLVVARQPHRRHHAARQISERMQPGVVYTTFHHPVTGANVVTTEYSDWATNCPEYKVTAVQVAGRTSLPIGRRNGSCARASRSGSRSSR